MTRKARFCCNFTAPLVTMRNQFYIKCSCMKVDRKIYKGIEYVLFSELPHDQQDQLVQTLLPDTFIKIMIEGVIVSKCLQFKDYNNWFENVYRTKQSHTIVHKPVAESISVNSSLALNKI
jgi:hypothetical protein